MGYQKRVSYKGRAINNVYNISGRQRVFYSTIMNDDSVYIFTKRTIYDNIEDEEFIGGMLNEIELVKTQRNTVFGGFSVCPFPDKWIVIYVENNNLKKVEYDLFFNKLHEPKIVYNDIYNPMLFKKNGSDLYIVLHRKISNNEYGSLYTSDFENYYMGYFHIDPNSIEYQLINKDINVPVFLNFSIADLNLP